MWLLFTTERSGQVFGQKEVKVVFADFQLVWLGINAFLFVHFYMAFLVEKWFYTRVLLGVSPPFHTLESYYIYYKKKMFFKLNSTERKPE